MILNEDNSDALELLEAKMVKSLTLKPHITDLTKERKAAEKKEEPGSRCILYFDRATYV